MKKFLALTLALLLLTLAACADTPKEAQTNTAPPAEATAEPTAVPTEEPTPEPTATPIPWIEPIGLRDLAKAAGDSIRTVDDLGFYNGYNKTISSIDVYYKNAYCMYTLPDGLGCWNGPVSAEKPGLAISSTWTFPEGRIEIAISEIMKSYIYDETDSDLTKALLNGIENTSDEEWLDLLSVKSALLPEHTSIDGCPAIIFIVETESLLLMKCVIDTPESTVLLQWFVLGIPLLSEEALPYVSIQTVRDFFNNVRILPKGET
ncbi:MAG: hypothetical protein FWF10_00305 [Clostridiales bacterium]|nr:hypothetical protein [Clostridiales bacterium]